MGLVIFMRIYKGRAWRLILQPDKRRGGPILPPSPVRLDCSWWIVIVDAVSAIAFDNMTVVFSESAETRPLTQPRAKS